MSDQAALIDAEDVPEPRKKRQPPTPPGPVYQGVSATVRRLTAKGKKHTGQEAVIDAELWAGTIAQAYSLARSIDRVDGRVPGSQANGVPLAQMHQQLDALLARLNPDAAEEGPSTMDALIAAMDREEARQNAARDAVPASHPEV